MKKIDIISSIILISFSLVFLLQAKGFSFGTLRAPEAGFLPIILGILLAILSLVFFGQSIRSKGEGRSPNRGEVQSWGKISIAVVTLFASALAFERLGYVLTSYFLVAFLLWTIGRHKWWVAVVVATLTSLGSFLIFGWLSGSSLPAGLLAW